MADQLNQIKQVLGIGNQSNISQEYNSASTGMNMDSFLSEIKKGNLTYALNAAVENFDANTITYQNETGNEFCLSFPKDYVLIGTYFIEEREKHMFFLVNPLLEGSEIGYMDNNDCNYKTSINDPCLGFNINYPIHKITSKITNCTTEIYWTDGFNSRRYLDIDNIPYLLADNSELCNPIYSTKLNCNKLKLQPNFSIPNVSIVDVTMGGTLLAGTYQFAAQYSDVAGNPYTSYYSVTNPTPIADIHLITVNYNYNVGKSIVVNINNLDITGEFKYYNLAVIKTINDITSVALVGTYFIDKSNKQITYTGQDVTAIQLSINDIFEKFPYYDLAEDVTNVQDVLVWDGLTSIDRINYQSIASNIRLQWETYKIPNTENYSNELNATNLRGYLRDEVYSFEIVFLLTNGKQTDGFHIPGRIITPLEESLPNILESNPDFIGTGISAPYWQIYNTATMIGSSLDMNIGTSVAYQYGEFAYWESLEQYPCNTDEWGSLAGQNIRHHKFPDILVSPIFESAIYTTTNNMVMQSESVYPIGVKLDVQQVKTAINLSTLTFEQKQAIVGYKIVRGNRSTNKSIIAKGILRNVNKYTRENQDYYFPNYPYNDLNADPFLNINNNAWSQLSTPWLVTANAVDPLTNTAIVSYTDPSSNKQVTQILTLNQTLEFCSVTRPITNTGIVTIGPGNYDLYIVDNSGPGAHTYWNDPFTNNNTLFDSSSAYIRGGCYTGYTTQITRVNVGFPPDVSEYNHSTWCGGSHLAASIIPQATVIQNQIIIGFSRRSSLDCTGISPLQAITSNDSKYRQVFNSPETSFAQPFLGNILKLENVMFGAGKAHFVEVKNNAKYRLLTKEAQKDALDSSSALGAITSPFSVTALFAAYQAYLTIYINGITRKNFAYSYNSIASYDYNSEIPNDLGIKQRKIELINYLIPVIQEVEDDNIPINNYERETSVYIKTNETLEDKTTPLIPLPFPTAPIIEKSRVTIGNSGMCATPEKQQPIQVVSYYASLKNTFINQWGQIYSYETIDTGYQKMLSDTINDTIFGGDTFISRFAFKTKLPFFIDNRVGTPDDSDVFYDEIGNVAYPKYWHSARSVLENYDIQNTHGSLPSTMINIISYKAHNFDCPNDPLPVSGSERTFYNGYFYLFAYGIPNFYCESSYNTDLRQAFNNKEGDFWPHVSTGIPDDWLQESFVSILNDNTYTYNVTYSKQNKENTFTHLPPDWNGNACYTHYPFRAIYSDPQNIDSDNRVNSWLTYRALSYFDFPQNYGKLISLDGIQNKAILARFENKSLMYDNLLTIDTSNPQAAYVGNPNMFKKSPPIDFAETDLGYVGSQNKMLLKIPNGQVTIDAKRGQIFLVEGTKVIDLSRFGSGMNRFLTDHLPFEILRYFPNINTDNHFNGIGIHGVYDSKFDRIIISKLDYIPLDNNIQYDGILNQYYIMEGLVKTIIVLKDQDYFCNKSWTLSFNMNTQSWISFHSYIPNFYIAENNFFYSGVNGCCDNFDFVVGELISTPSTTTTTSSSTSSTTTTTTTSTPLDCNLEGIITLTDCTLEGTAIITVLPICQRPMGLTNNHFVTGYDTIPVTSPVVSTGSQIDACNAITFMSANETTVFFIIGSYIDLSIGQTIYDGTTGTDCTTIPDGWYFTEESMFTDSVYHVVDGIITEINSCSGTTTTTSSTTVLETCYSYTATKYTGGVVTIFYKNCSGGNTEISVGNIGGGESIVSFCAEILESVPGGVSIVLNGPC